MGATDDIADPGAQVRDHSLLRTALTSKITRVAIRVEQSYQ